jgi:hypothetical protein
MTDQPNPLTIRCSEQEKDAWRAQAAVAGMSTNAWCKAVLNTACKGLLPTGERCAHPNPVHLATGDWCNDCGERVERAGQSS